ncbi:23 kDa jasmonate-induced protein-like [Ziziphus jujuba]|uniref:23 kDa jasmonate-induced protein-like n=1 Tax=Ziziphus jujuba TaxID=326968 RepID=A0ABM4A8E2_ZIZJJ|nr:23 kDa jasmonate-induced protein-like [Ziziphus jujuba]
MAANVFGNPVTDDTVRLVYPGIQKITAKHRAEVALMYKNAEDKHVNVNRYVHNLKASYGTGTSTLCMIYNATGGNLTFSSTYNWDGQVWQSPYPPMIQNGQWAGFLHVRSRLVGPSKAAVVYSGRNNDGSGCDWMLAWNTKRLNYDNRVYTEIRGAGHFNVNRWDYINSLLKQQSNNHSDTWNGCYSIISVGGGSSPALEATMTLADLDAKFMEIARAIAMPEGLDSKTVDDDGDAEAPAE